MWGISWVPWGCSIPWGISWVPWGVILSTVGGVQYHGGYHDACGGISCVPWGVFSTVGDTILWNLSTVGGYHDTCGGYHEYRGVFNTMGYSNNKRFSPHGTEHPPRYSWYPHVHHDIPPWYWTSPTVLKITPHSTHDIPHGTEHPHGTQDIPHIYHDIPTVLNTPTVLKISPHGTHDIPPRYSWYPPRYSWYPPRYWKPPTVLHTHYTGWVSEWFLPWQEIRLKEVIAVPLFWNSELDHQ